MHRRAYQLQLLLLLMLIMATSSSVNIVAKANTTSPVWAYFGLEASADGKPVSTDRVICRLCETTVQAKGSSTTNLFTHLKKHHPLKHSELLQSTKKSSKPSTSTQAQPTITEAMEKARTYQRHSKKWQQLTDSVTYCLTKDMMPLYSVEKEGFRKMLHVFDSQYELPGRKYFSQTAVPALYTSVREKIVNELAPIDYFSSTADMWSSETGEPYLAYTVHFIDMDWTLKSRCLQALFLPEDHTADNIADAITTTLTNWSLPISNQVRN